MISNSVDKLNALLAWHEALYGMWHRHIASMIMGISFRAQDLIKFCASIFAMDLSNPIAMSNPNKVCDH